MSRKGKTQVGRIVLLAIIMAVAAMAGFLILRPDYRYLAVETMANLGAHMSLEEVDPSELELVSRSLEELRENGQVAFEQSEMLINSDHPLGDSFVAQISSYQNTDVVMNTCVMEAYEALAAAVQERFGERLYVKSAYRTAEEQEEEVRENTARAAPLNASEHQAGLALDVYVPSYPGRSFIKTDAGQYVNSNCWQYGFIIRYPYYGEQVTGIPYEPWHLRYVGAPHAEIIYKGQTTLEEYVASLEVGKFYRYGEYLVTRQSGEALKLPETFDSTVISPDNEGNYIVTVKMSG